MHYKFLTLCLLLLATISQAKTKIAIIDTGLDIMDPRFTSHLCQDSFDLTGKGINDDDGHGTHVAGLIKQYAKNADYCLLIIKFYAETMSDSLNAKRFAEAIELAIEEKADVVNISGGGERYSDIEAKYIKGHPEVIFIVAAGNADTNIDITPYYPAAYKFSNVIAVGCVTNENKRCPFSNYGNKVKEWEKGMNVYSTLPHNSSGPMSGTSMSTAIFSGKYVYNKWSRNK